MAGKKFSFVLFEEDDPVVFALLTQLDRYARGKRIRHMLRTAALIEASGSQLQTVVVTAPATVSGHVSKNLKPVLIEEIPEEDEMHDALLFVMTNNI